MALIKLSGMISKISGKLGGSIFGTSSNGAYVKQNSFSQQPNTPGQSIQRNKIVQASQSWRLTTQVEKDLWQAETVNYPYINRVGETVFYNAFQLFQFLNQNNFQNGFPILSSPPMFTPVDNANWIVSYFPVPTLAVVTTNGVSGTTCQIFVSPQMAPGVTPKSSEYRFLQSITVLGGNQTNQIEAAYEQMFGTLEVGRFVYAKVKTIVTNNGNSANFGIVSSVEIT